MSATEASRNFSDLLGRVSSGETVNVVRNGVSVAIVVPPARTLTSADAFRQLMTTAPAVDEAFGDDVTAARAGIGPPESPWPS